MQVAGGPGREGHGNPVFTGEGDLVRSGRLPIGARESLTQVEMQNQCAEIKLRAERKAGNLLGEVIQRGGNPNSHGDRLVDFGIDHHQSRRQTTQFSQCFVLDLTDPLRSHGKPLANLFECAFHSVVNSVAHPNNPFFSGSQCLQHCRGLLLEIDADRQIRLLFQSLRCFKLCRLSYCLSKN